MAQFNDICYNCGAGKGLHKSDTLQCPVGGIEEKRYDELNKRFYPQKWSGEVFEDESQKKLELAAYTMSQALLAAKGYLEYLVDYDYTGHAAGDEKILEKIDNALNKAGLKD